MSGLILRSMLVSALQEPIGSPNPLDTVLINFPKSISRAHSRHLYLPPEDSFNLPEVIDNRVRVFFRPTPTPEIHLKAPPSGSLVPAYGTPKHSTNEEKTQMNEDDSNQMTITSMSCRNFEEDVYFRASINSPIALVIEGASSDVCKIDRINDEYKINFFGDLFWNCGVQDCSTESGKFYCLTLRFPAIPGLRLKEDTKVSLRCRTQERMTSHTKRFSVKTVDTSARMAARVATGGHNNAFETEVGLFRRTLGSEHLFDAKIQPGGTVVLGEEILLRAAVRGGDGWKYSKLSDVTINFIESSGEKRIMKRVWILDSSGCVNPEVRDICSREQYRVAPLESYLTFQAFMFDKMQETDELIMSVKITACLEGNDCILNCPSGHSRKTRSLKELRNNTRDWLNDISFRVTLPKAEEGFSSQHHHMIIPYALSSLILVAIGALLCTIKVMRKQGVRQIGI